MKAKFIAPLALLSLIAFSPVAFSATKTDTTKKEQVEMKKDAEAMGWASAIDNFEIKAAQVALDKNVTGDVKDYATMLHDDHTKNLSQLDELSNKIGEKPAETKDITKFNKDGDKQLEKLKATDEKEFSKVFMKDMVAGHKGGLKKIDSIMKHVKNPEVEAFLKSLQEMIKHHLTMAEKIQKDMK